MEEINKIYLDENKNLYIKRNGNVKDKNIIFIKFENWVLDIDLKECIFEGAFKNLLYKEKEAFNIENYYDNLENLEVTEINFEDLTDLMIDEIEKIKNENISKLKRSHLRFWGVSKYFDENNKGKKIKLTIKINNKDYPKHYTEPKKEYTVIFDINQDIIHFESFLYTFDNDLIKSTKGYDEIITNFELI